MPAIKITSGVGWAKVAVDGVELRQLTSLVVNLQPQELPEVVVTMHARDGDIDMESGTLKIAGVDMPEAVERALLEHLCRKYPNQALVHAGLGGIK